MAELQTYRFTNEIENIEVSSYAAKIIIQPHDASEIYVEYNNPRNTPEFCAVLSGKTLTLKENLSFSIFGAKPTEEYTIKIFLPAVCYAKLKINTASGGAVISDITAELFDLNTASGAININAYFDNVKIQSASGSVTLNAHDERTAKSLSVCTVSGSANVNGYKAEKFSLHTVSGKTAYNGAVGEGSVSVTSGSVDVTYDEWNADLNVSAISGNVNLYFPEGAGLDINFTGMSGSLKTDIGNTQGQFMNLGRGTAGVFGGENQHKLNISLTSGNVTAAQRKPTLD